ADGVLAAVTGHKIDDALQQVGAAIPMVLDQQSNRAELIALSVINRLRTRSGPGDWVLSEDLLDRLRGEQPAGQLLPVDLDMLSSVLAGDPDMSFGGFIDLQTGEVYHDVADDPMFPDDNTGNSINDEPDRWLAFEHAGSQDAWQDM